MTKAKIPSGYTKGEQDRHHTMQIRGVDPKHPTYGFGRQIDDRRKVKAFVEHPDTKHHYVSIKGVYGAKAKSKVHGEIKSLLGLGPTDEYHASWNDGRNSKDDSVKVSYRKNSANESTELSTPILEKLEIALLMKEHDISFEEAKSLSAKLRLAKKYATGGHVKQAARLGDKIGRRSVVAARRIDQKKAAWDTTRETEPVGSEHETTARARFIAAVNKGDKVQSAYGKVLKAVKNNTDTASAFHSAGKKARVKYARESVELEEAKSAAANLRLAKKYASGKHVEQAARIGTKIGRRAVADAKSANAAQGRLDAVRELNPVDQYGRSSDKEIEAYKDFVTANRKSYKTHRRDNKVADILQKNKPAAKAYAKASANARSRFAAESTDAYTGSEKEIIKARNKIRNFNPKPYTKKTKKADRPYRHDDADILQKDKPTAKAYANTRRRFTAESTDTKKLGDTMIDYEAEAKAIGDKVKAIVQKQAKDAMAAGMEQEKKNTLKEGYYDGVKPGKMAPGKTRSPAKEKAMRSEKIAAEIARQRKSKRLG